MKSNVLPAWMYGDPAEVVERQEQGDINRAMRAAERMVRDQRARFGLVSPATVRKVNQQRVREVMRRVRGK